MPAVAPSEMRTRKIQSVDMPLDLNDVLLVAMVVNEDREVIVRHVQGGEPFYEREPGSTIPRHTRYAAGTGEELAWPDPYVSNNERFESDTPRKYVDEITYIPEVLSGPLPKDVAAELEVKYSRKRTRHEDSWVARKIVEDARSAWYEQRRLVTPAQQRLELLAKERQEQQQKGQTESPIWSEIRQETGQDARP